MTSTKDSEFLKKLLATFRIEADENLKSITAGLLELEKAPDPDTQMRLIERIFREAHSLKGAARAVNKRDVELVCQAIENVFSALKQRKLTPLPAMFDTLHLALDTIEALLPQPEGEESTATTEVVERLNRLIANGGKSAPLPRVTPAAGPPAKAPAPEQPAPPALPSPPQAEAPQREEPAPSAEKSPVPLPVTGKLPATADTVRISVAKLDKLLLQAEELLAVKLTTHQHVTDLHEIDSMLDLWQREWAKAVPEIQRVQRYCEQNSRRQALTGGTSPLVKLLDFLDWNRAHMEVLIDRLHVLTKFIEQEERSVGGMVDNLLESVKNSLMLPFSTLLDTFPKMTRDLARAEGKEIELTIKGSETEIDRRILEEVKTPLIHILRNCIDHGIEKPVIREKQKKSKQGHIIVTVSQLDASKIEIIISDDGAGINLDKLKLAAVQQGYLSPQEAELLNPTEALALIYRSAVSTSTIITDMSGRGLGMAIVQEKVEQLGGKIQASTATHIGTTFQITLPVTVATFRGVLIEAGRRTFVIPTAGVERALRFKKDAIKVVQNRPVIELDGRVIPVAWLTDVLEMPPVQAAGQESPYLQLLILGTVARRKAFVVDRIINEQEVLTKSLGKQLTRVRNVAGATVLGSGQVVPILHVPDLLKSAERLNGRRGPGPAVTTETVKIKKSVLVAEDSITSRMLLKNILEGAGYQVKTTVDGVDALTALKTDHFDLLVSDIEMPRMDGFELTAKIRADQKLAELPIVLVTSLGSQEDRERGIDAGADAYITKSSFDQTNLLAIIKRLV